MKHAQLRTVIVTAVALAGGLLQAEEARWKIAVIPKGTTHVFWKSVEAGARAAGEELGVDIVWKGPLKENDRAQQIAIVEQFLTEGVAGIVLAPLDDTALRRPVQTAMQKKIPVVIIDSALRGEPGKDFVSFVATDNRKGGRLAGEELARLLNGQGRLVLLRNARRVFWRWSGKTPACNCWWTTATAGPQPGRPRRRA